MERQNPAANINARGKLWGAFDDLCRYSRVIRLVPSRLIALDRMGRPVVYISPIAQHTKNIVADPESSANGYRVEVLPR
jgi:hypothetical protein